MRRIWFSTMISNCWRQRSGSTAVTSTGGGPPELLTRIVRRAETLQRGGEREPVAHVGGKRHGGEAALREVGDMRLELRGIAGEQADAAAFEGQRFGDGEAQALACAADQGRLFRRV